MSALIISRDPLDVTEALATVARDGHGGSAVFIGTTRAEGEGADAVTALAYDGYEEMARGVVDALADDVHARFGAALAVLHRLGEVPVGQPSLVVAATAPHRDAAFRACRHAVEAIKQDLPIWKQEIRANGCRVWRDGVAASILSSP